MLLFLSISGIFLSAILLYFNARNNRSTVYLGLFFLFLSLYSLYQYILLYSESVTLVKLFLVNIAIVSSPVYLIGPMLYWYIRSVLTDDSKLKKNDIWHFLPMAIFFIAAFPHSFVPWQEKVEAAKSLVQDTNFIMGYKSTLLSMIFPVASEYLARPLLVLGYTLWSAGLCINYLRKGKVSAVFAKQHFMKKWLCLFLGLLLILEIFHIFLVDRAFEMNFSDQFFHPNILRFLDTVGIIGLLILPFFFPSILYGMPRVGNYSELAAPATHKHTPPNSYIKNNHLHFEIDYLDSVGQQADICMAERQPYVKPDFNLADLSTLTQIPAHHLSYYFRETRKQHFVDYRNRWRVSHAKKLISEGRIRENTLESIGMQSGFSNRNTFLTAFKRLEGTSPNDWTALNKRPF